MTWEIDALQGSPLVLNNGATLNVTFQLETNCTAVSGSLNSTIDYTIPSSPPECDSSGVLDIQVNPGAVTIKMTPNVIPQVVGQNVTWTLSVENTGVGVIENVEVTSLLDVGLAYVSATENGNNSGQTTTWGSTEYAALASMAPGETLSMNITATLIACENLNSVADVRFGCEPSPAAACFDTSIDGGTAKASVQHVVLTPVISFTPPDINFTYCDDTENFSFAISNIGDGIAYDVYTVVDFTGFIVSNVSTGAIYNNVNKRFELTAALAANGDFGDFYNLSFDLTYTDWCNGNFPSGDLLWQKLYKDECDQEFYPSVELSSINPPVSTSSLSVSIGGAPAVVQIGDSITYVISSSYSGLDNCSSSTIGMVTVVDSLPDGVTVVDSGGGVWVVGGGGSGGTITWTYTPPASLSTSISVQVPDASQCETYCNTYLSNSITANVIDCCGCDLSDSDSQLTAIECAEGVSSEKTSTSPTQRCRDTRYTNTYTFFGDSGVELSDLNFTEHAESQQVYNANLSINLSGTGDIASSVAVTDTTPGGSLTLDFSGCPATPLAGQTLTIDYDLTATSAVIACAETTFYSWSSLDLGVSGSACLGDGIIHETTEVSIISPGMALIIDGLGDTFHTCESKTITITLTQISANTNPKDVKLVLSGLNYLMVNPSGVVCGGDVAPVSCTPTIDANGNYFWMFNDVFNGSGELATLQFDLQKRCGGNGELKATVYYDDLCSDDTTSDEICSTVASETPVLLLSGDLLIEKTPEIYYADSNRVQWEIYLTNRGTGTAYNVWMDDELGSGLMYEHGVNPVVVDNMSGVTINDSLGHDGGAINGASVEITSMAAGERRQITFIAKQTDCNNLTNNVTANWGCLSGDCQSDVTDSSVVTNPVPNLINTTTINPAAGVEACSSPLVGLISLRNSAQVTVYNLRVTETLPFNLSYVSGSTRWRINSGSWNGPNAIYDPSSTNSPLVWSSTQIPALASVDPGDTIEIEFGLAFDCPFNGGDITVSTQYENPCADFFHTTPRTFTASFNTPVIEVQLTRADTPVNCGESLQWSINVTNQSGYTLPLIWVEESLGAAFTFDSSAGDPTYTSDNGTNVGQMVAWELNNLPHGATAILTLNAIANASCSSDLSNSVTAYWGCGSSDGSSTTKPGQDAPDNTLCLSVPGFTDERTETREPDMNVVSVVMNPTAINACDSSAELTVIIENSGLVDASDVDCVITLPSGLTYDNSSHSGLSTDQISATGLLAGIANPAIVGSVLTWRDIWDKGNNIADTIQADGGNDTLVLRFNVQSACYTTADLKLDLYYYDCCDNAQYSVTKTQSLTALAPSLSVTQTPTLSQVDCGAQQSWSITVTNNGSGNAQVVRVEDMPGTWIDVRTGESSDPVDMGGGVYGWEINNLAAGGGTAVFTLVGTLNPDNLPSQDDCAGNLRQNHVRAIWACGVGGEASDGDPTTQAYGCTVGTWVEAVAATLLLPNLVTTEITPEITCNGDGDCSGTIIVRVQNQGDGVCSENFTVNVTGDGNGWSGSGTYTGASIAANAFADVTIDTSTWSPDYDTSYTITAEVDSGGTECECNESDNTFTGTAYTAQIPDLQITSIDFDDLGCSDDAISGSVDVDVQNLGGATASTFQVSLTANNGLTFANASVASLAAGASATLNFNLTGAGANCSLADCQFTATADVANDVCESDGSNNTRLETTPPYQVKLYWSDSTGQVTQRANRDGSSLEDVADAALGVDEPQGVAVDETHAKLYWVNGAAGTIQQSDLDGLNVHTLVSALTSPLDIALDSTGGKIYWTDNGDNAIYSTDLNGANQETLLSGMSDVGGLALDVGANKLYWTEPADGELWRADLDGTNQEILIGAGLSTPLGLSLDLMGLKMYFSDPGSGKIQKSDLDGSNLEDVRVGLGADVRFLDLDEAENLIYFSTNSSSIRSVGFDGSGFDDVITGLSNSSGVALYRPASNHTNINLTVNDLTLAITCLDNEKVSGEVTVNVIGTGATEIEDVLVRVTSNCGITFTDQTIDLIPGESRDLIFNYISDCSDDCIFTAEIDPDNEVCECDAADNSASESSVNVSNVPTVTTDTVSNLSSGSATLNGSVNACNSSTIVTFEYGLDISYSSSIEAETSPVIGMCSGSVSRLITGLTPNTTYHYRVIGVNGAGTTNGADQTFITDSTASIVTTQVVTDIASTTATGNGNITSLSEPHPNAHGVCWSTSSNPVVTDSHSDEGVTSLAGAFTSDITTLLPGTTYYVRAYATNSTGTSYGENQMFTTLAPEMDLRYDGNNFADGDTLDFGNQATSSDTDVTFTVENAGTAPLTITTPLTFVGVNADQFSIQAQPTSTVGASGTTAFTVRFTPTSAGIKTAAISIDNSDSDENPYDLTITGIGVDVGISIGALSSTTTNEGGATATFTVVLDSEPTNNVVIPVSSSDTSEGAVSSTSLSFTPTNWGTVQTVTVTGVNDDLYDGDVAYTVVIGPAVSDDTDYNGNNPGDKYLTNNDNDLDSDGDGVSDVLEGTGDRDGDGFNDSNDYDPTGYFYDSSTGEIIVGGSVSVSGSGNAIFVSGRNGADGYYQFTVDHTGTYTITVTPPVGYVVDNSGCAVSGSLTANSIPNPLVLGSGEDGTTGHLAAYSCADNEWYLIINIQDTTPLILNNNIPLVSSEAIPTLNEWGMIISSSLLLLAALTVLRRRQ